MRSLPEIFCFFGAAGNILLSLGNSSVGGKAIPVSARCFDDVWTVG
jgi:hypothetical protein